MPSIDFNLLPNFLVIGSPRCGTTSLHNVLAQNANVFAAKEKELHFFDNDKYQNGLKWYQDRYFSHAGGFLARGETTPNYLSMAHLVAPRISESYGPNHLKFIAIFRDPVKRAYSHYWYRRNWSRESAATFEKALKSEWEGERNELASIFRAGCYASLLKYYFNFFPRHDFQLMIMDDYLNCFQETIHTLDQFLGLPNETNYQLIHENQASAIRSKSFQAILQRKDHPFNRLGRKIKKTLPEGLADAFRNKLHQANLKPFKPPQMDQKTERELRYKYYPEIMELEEIMGRDLSAWYKDVNGK